MEFEQSGTPHSPQQAHTNNGRGSFEAGRLSGPPRQLLPPQDPVKSAALSPRQGEFSLDREVANSSVELATHTGFDRAHNASAGYLPIVEQQAGRTSVSPLPVENETVRGQDQLFDDHKSGSDPCETHTDDEDLDSLPHTPIDLPVLLEPILKHRHDKQGLPTLMDELGSWAVVTEKGEKDIVPQFSSKLQPSQDIRDPTRSVDTGAGTGGNRSRNNDHGGQGASQPQHGPVKLLYSHVLAGIFGPSHESESPSPHDATTADFENMPGEQRDTSDDERYPIHSRHRGRQMERSLPSPERTLNPREQLFQGNEDDIDIKSAWFKRSKRGLS